MSSISGGRGAVWMSRTTPNQLPSTQQFAVDTERVIAERPYLIVISRKVVGQLKDAQLPPQTVRLEIIQSIRGASDQVNQWLDVSLQHVVLVGYKDHPTIPNTDIQRADQFFFENHMWEVKEIILTLPGRLMASADITP